MNLPKMRREAGTKTNSAIIVTVITTPFSWQWAVGDFSCRDTRAGCHRQRRPRHFLHGHGQPIRRQMRIPQNHFEVGVPHQVADRVEINAGLHEAARKVVPQIMEPEVLQVRALHELSPSRVDAREFGAARAPKDITVVAHPTRLLLPAAEDRERFDIQRNTPSLSALGGRSLDSEPLTIDVHIAPLQVQEFPAPHPGIEGEQHHRPNVIDELRGTQRQRCDTPDISPAIETHAVTAQLLLAREECVTQLLLLGIAQVARSPRPVTAERLDLGERMLIDDLPQHGVCDQRAQPLQVPIDGDGGHARGDLTFAPLVDEPGSEVRERLVEPLRKIGSDALKLKLSGSQIRQRPGLVALRDEGFERALAGTQVLGRHLSPLRQDINAARHIAGGDHRELPRHRGADARESSEHQASLRAARRAVAEVPDLGAGRSNAQAEPGQGLVVKHDVLVSGLHVGDDALGDLCLHAILGASAF